MLVTLADLWRSRTAGQIAVGGKTKVPNFPSEHSIFTLFAQRLCNVI
jgi:hypothetical protein